MKNLPIKAITGVVDRNILPLKEAVNTPQSQDNLSSRSQNVDASIVSLPRSKSKDVVSAADPSAVLDSFLSEVSKGEDLVTAHSGLDASRVFDLLNDED